MTKLRFALKCAASGAGWSITYLFVVAWTAHAVGSAEALVIAWPLKIAWSTAHTAFSRWRGAVGATCATCAA